MQRCFPRCNVRGRRYSILVAPRGQRLEIPRAGNSSVAISIHEPLLKPGSGAPPSAVLFFSRGLLHNEADEDATISTLRSTVPHPIVQVHYRIGKDAQHPSSVYDSLAAFDWAAENFLAPNASKSARNGGIAVCGELLGGTLASVLSLTECRAGQHRVLAAAINNPILDWVDLEQPLRRVRRANKQHANIEAPPSNLTIDQMRSMRLQMFKKPADQYDPFASPLLFFRSAGSSPPPPLGPGPKSDFDLALENDTDHNHEVLVDHGAEDRPLIRMQPRSSRHFPSRAHGLMLPKLHVSAGDASLLKFQAEEFVQQYSQSILRQRRAPSRRRVRRHDDFFDHDPVVAPTLEDLAQNQAAYVAARLQYKTCPGSGFWDDTPVGRAAIHEMAIWLRESLEARH